MALKQPSSFSGVNNSRPFEVFECGSPSERANRITAVGPQLTSYRRVTDDNQALSNLGCDQNNSD